MITRTPLTLVLAVLTFLALSGCDQLGGEVPGQPTITEEPALARVEKLIRDTAAQMDPQPQLERLVRRASDRGQCLDPQDGGSEDRIQVSRRYWLREIPEERNGEIGRQVKAYWQSQGHKVIEATGIEDNKPDIFVRTKDFFTMSVTWSTDGSLSIGASSPCIWPNGTSEPYSEPTTSEPAPTTPGPTEPSPEPGTPGPAA